MSVKLEKIAVKACQRLSLVLFAMVMVLFAACSGSDNTNLSDESTDSSAEEESLADPAIVENLLASSDPVPEVFARLHSEPGLLAPVPEIQFTQTMANTGIQISYTDLSLVPLAPGEVVEAQWIFMQECLQLMGIAPVVLITQQQITPFTENDDVVRNQTLTATEILSIPIASASTLHGHVVQVRYDDFDGSLGTPSFNLRSIMGRSLWLANGLPARDYPYECARQTK